MRSLLLGGVTLALCSTMAVAQNQPASNQPSSAPPAQNRVIGTQTMQAPTRLPPADRAQAGQQPAAQSPQNAAIKSTSQNNSSVPVAGANSFTEGEARSRIQARGYSNVGSLTKDKDGIWRGTATKDGQQVAVSVDYQGNVN